VHVKPLDALQPYLFGPDDIISADRDDQSYRLTFHDKMEIEQAIHRHGPMALQNVTKGGAMLYLRSAMRFSGADEPYLRSLFAPETSRWNPDSPALNSWPPLSVLPYPSVGWPIKEEKAGLPFSGSPEEAALALLAKDGWKGVHSEGNTLRCLFRSILLPYLIDKNPYASVDPERTPLCHAIHYLIPMTAVGIDGILANTRSVPRQAIEEMHRFIDWRLNQPVYGVRDDFVRVCRAHAEVWPRTPDPEIDVLKFLQAVPASFWHDLLEIYARYDGTLSSGWPDLEITDGNSVEMIEVKVRDRLTASQKITIPILMGMGIKCRVVRLVNTRN